MSNLTILISGPEIAEALAKFMPELASAMRAEQARQEAYWATQNAGRGIGIEPLPAPVAPVSTATDAMPAPAPAEKKPRAVKKTVEPEPETATGEDGETCLDALKTSAAAQQELPLEKAPTIDSLRSALRAYGSTEGADALTALYAEYGVAKLTELPEDKYAEIIKKVTG
jgi:hypothetical protein